MEVPPDTDPPLWDHSLCADTLSFLPQSSPTLRNEVIKRDVLEGEKADAARKKVAKAAGKVLRTRKEAGAAPGGETVPDPSEEPQEGS